jgi:hypothetical protein
MLAQTAPRGNRCSRLPIVLWGTGAFTAAGESRFCAAWCVTARRGGTGPD